MKMKTLLLCLALAMCFGFMLGIMGCGGGATGGATPGGGGAGTTYTYGGTLTEQNSVTPIGGAAVTMSAETGSGLNAGVSGLFSNSTITDASGKYSFTGVPAGNYTVLFRKNGYYDISLSASLSSNQTTSSSPMYNPSTWNTLMGDASHPYDASYAYLFVQAVDQSTGTSISGVQINCTSGTFTSQGYVKNDNTIDWTATTGASAFLYKIPSGSSLDFSATKSGYTSSSLSKIKPTVGQITVIPIQCTSGSGNINRGTSGDDTQIFVGTADNDIAYQYGFGGNDTQYASGLEGDDYLYQDGGADNDTMSAMGGGGNDTIFQTAGDGNNIMAADGASGDDNIRQSSGSGNDRITSTGGEGNDALYLNSGEGDDAFNIHGGAGNDTVSVGAGAGNDNITFFVSAGTDEVYIDGGTGDDTLTVNVGSENNFTIVGATGAVIYQSGTGGNRIQVSNIEHINVIGPDGQSLFHI